MHILEFEHIIQEKLQVRVGTGDRAQRAAYAYIKTTYPELDIGSPRYAKQHSHGTDMVLRIQGHAYRFEIKNRTNRHVLIQLFSETVHRGDPGVVSAVFLNMMSYGDNLTAVIDQHRRKDKTVGFSGDPGVLSQSGRMPVLAAPNRPVLKALRDQYVANLKQHQISYFMIQTLVDESMQLYFTGYGDNPLRAPMLPVPPYARLDTAGAADQPGTIRAAVKVRFD